jgi:phosphonate transport system substrate-binding protein
VLLLAAVLVVVPVLLARAHGDDHPIRFGVFPFLPPLTLDQTFQPVVAELSEAVGAPVVLRTKDTFLRFRNELAAGSYDLVLVHPFFYTYAAEMAGYQALARLDQDLITVLLAPPETGIDSIEALKGRVLGLPDELAAVSVVMKIALFDHGLRAGRDVEVRHFQSKLSCLHAAAVGDVDACGVPRFVLAQIDLARELGLEIFYEAPPIMHFVLAVHPRLALDDCIKIRQRVLTWASTAKGRRMLQARGWRGFVPAEDTDYDGIRALEARVRQLAMRP